MIHPTFKDSNILIVDDQVANIDVLEGFLAMQGYSIIKSTTDPRKAISLFQTFEPDLILLDLSMPYLSGFEVLQLLKPFLLAKTFVPILVLSADITKEEKQRALSEGASDFLTKPFDLIEVGLRIKNLLFTKYLIQQLGSQNQILEEKVKLHIRDMEQTNIELIAARDKAEASNRLKTAFLNNISHEIRTPLNGILCFAPMTIDPGFSDTQKNEFLEILNLSSKRLMQTISDYMDISLITSDNMEVTMTEFSPGQILEEIQKQFQSPCTKKGISLKIQKLESFNSVVINSDSGFLKKILTHLVDNALKFTEKGAIEIGVSIKVNFIEFYVKDSGIGISTEALSLIFDHFSQEDFSTTRRHGGSGLGLAIVKGLILLLGGTINAESAKDVGSTFTFTIPWELDSPNVITSISSEHKVSGLQRPVILVAEDEPYGYLLFELSLENDYEIIRAEDGDEAVEFCKLIPEIQLVLIDLKMPKMNGLIATREIKKFRKDLPIIALTAYAETGMRAKCLEAGCDEYLAKPVGKMELLKKIQRFMVTI
jgi:two-component system sensor histidine kinase/response regulator